jgi:hypothetical protein
MNSEMERPTWMRAALMNLAVRRHSSPNCQQRQLLSRLLYASSSSIEWWYHQYGAVNIIIIIQSAIRPSA